MEASYVEKHKIFECIIGSRAYGIHNEDSDTDKAGVMIPGIEYFFGNKNFDQFQGYDTDKTIYNIRKIVNLITENNPNCMDLINYPEHCLIYTTPYWDKIVENKDLFISKKCKFTFSGYACQQLRRIKVHRKYLLNPPKSKPERSDYGLKENSICELPPPKRWMASWSILLM